MIIPPRTAARLGGHVVAESLAALGAEVVFGLPGVHALPIWEGLRETSLRTLPFRQEVNAGFAADGCARTTGRPAPLVLSTGPGALMSLAPLMEAAIKFFARRGSQGRDLVDLAAYTKSQVEQRTG